MSTAEDAARGALDAAVGLVNESGLLDAVRDLQREVWAANVDRYEPDELGDTARSLGLLTFENFTTRAVRRHAHDDREPQDRHWRIDDLRVTTPNGVLTLEIGSIRIVGMKVPPTERRAPRWDRFVDWDSQSNTRLEIAQENSKVLGGFKTPDPGQGVLADFHVELGRKPDVVRNFLYVWAGEFSSPLTSAWLTVPALGGHPFAAVAPLWHDRDGDLPGDVRRSKRGPDGPSFDQKRAPEPSISLKPRPAADGQA